MANQDQVTVDEASALMDEYFETTDYVGEIQPWREVPETGDDPDGEPVAEPVIELSAGKQSHSGMMVALPVPSRVATHLMVSDGVDPDQMHVTLCYIKGAVLDAKTDDEIEQLFDVVQEAVYGVDPFDVEVQGTGIFPASDSSDGMDVLYAVVPSNTELSALRKKVVTALQRAGAAPSSDFDYSPHITLSYLTPEEEYEPDDVQAMTFPAMTVVASYQDRDVSFDLGVKSYRDGAGISALRRLPMVITKGVESVRTSDIFKRPASKYKGALNRKTTANSIGTVPLADLEPTVETLPLAGVERLITHPRRDPADIMVVRGGSDGSRRYVVQDGHARLAAAILRGSETVEARLWNFEIDALGDLVPEPRGLHRRGRIEEPKLLSYRARLAMMLSNSDAARKAWDTRGRREESELSVDERALQTHLVDFKAERGLTGPGSARIDELIDGAEFREYLKVPDLDRLHAAMKIEPSLDTDPLKYQAARDEVFKSQPVKEVPFEKLTFTQPRINTARVNELATVTSQLDKPVQIIKSGDRFYLMNGHHRVGGSYVAGRKTVRGHVFDAGARKNLSRLLAAGMSDDQNIALSSREAALKAWDTRGRKADSIAESDVARRSIGEKYRSTNALLWDAKSHDTLDAYKNEPQRHALHDAIVRATIGDVPSVDEPTVFFVGGGPGAGKTTLIKSGVIDIPPERERVMSNPDDVKDNLPEYLMGKEVRAPFISSVVHEESSMVAKRIASTALHLKKNTVVDNVGDSGIETLEKRIAGLRADGAKRVVAHYVTVDTDEAWRRVEKRREETGRAVPESVVRHSHADVSRTFQQAVKRGIFDEVNLYESSENPIVIARGRGKKLDILDQAAWDRFTSKVGAQ